MTNTRYPTVKLAGTPKERGRLYGGACRSMIDASIRNYADMFSAFSGISWESAKALALEYLPFIRDYCPKAVDEMEGIAEGSARRIVTNLDRIAQTALGEGVERGSGVAVGGFEVDAEREPQIRDTVDDPDRKSTRLNSSHW